MEALIKKREVLRNQIRAIWKRGGQWTEDDKKVIQELNELHAKIISLELHDPTKSTRRDAYSVCGWSERHGYFRNKRFSSFDLNEAKAEFEKAKKDPDWKIPTIIVNEIYLRAKSPAMVDFDGDFPSNIGFSEHQTLVDKHMCGNRHYRWKDLLSINEDRYTY